MSLIRKQQIQLLTSKLGILQRFRLFVDGLEPSQCMHPYAVCHPGTQLGMMSAFHVDLQFASCVELHDHVAIYCILLFIMSLHQCDQPRARPLGWIPDEKLPNYVVLITHH